MKAWIVTWECLDRQVEASNKVVTVLSARVGSEQVRRHVERLYVDARSSWRERLDLARYNKSGPNPNPAEFVRIRVGNDNVRWMGRIICGPDPHLLARLVENLRVVVDEDGDESLDWSEIPMPEFPGQ